MYIHLRIHKEDTPGLVPGPGLGPGPGPEGIIVREEDVNFLIENFLHDYGYRWTDIGPALGFSYGEIRTIDMNVRGDANRGLRDLLMMWFHWPINGHEEYPTLEKLRDALCTRVVGLGDVARHLYERRNELPSIQGRNQPPFQ